LRFLLDNDVAATVRRVLLDAGHECWTVAEANLYDAADDAVAVYATDRGAALISHDAEFARRRRRNTIGQHVWLRCTEPQASAVLSQHLAEVVGVLGRMADVVIEVRPERLIVSPPRWE
jgi:predicted nuclease of predicted toxin-antitoxin system